MVKKKKVKEKIKETNKKEIEKTEKIKRIFIPKIILNKCTKCNACWIFCPHGAISLNEKGEPVINYDLCRGCLICLRECPESAIEEERE
jgi:2-oxoacid:acceptor oxidoreductase delta subunit (pyruvate/2-ketoisovalerate family)